ncbi:hypothetical protein AB0K43_08805 [Kitasatospora sp. NPDC049258]|uniref:hypothetical protein n=1 Tax=Kitasatospora sp. NPDC049258 TaxID=3155394 RepID=UPI00343BDE8C
MTVGESGGPERSGPRPGELVRDHRSDRVGVLMDVHGGRLYLRPPGGGVEWTTEPDQVGPAGGPDLREPA